MGKIMKHVNREKVAYVVPSVEVVVRAGEQELAIIAFYPAKGGEWDVLVGLSYPDSRANIGTVLKWAAEASASAAFPRGVPTFPTDHGDKPDPLDDLPF